METIGVKQSLTKRREEIPSSGGIKDMKLNRENRNANIQHVHYL